MSNAGVEKRGSAATVRACDLCRKRKRRCLWNSGTEGCSPCMDLKESCTTTHVRKLRSKPQKGNCIAEYESRIQRLESLLQERNAAQPHINEQPLLQGPDPSVPVSTWVANLRHDVEMMPRPAAPDFDPYELEFTADVAKIQNGDGLLTLSLHETSHDGYTSSSDVTLPVSLDDIQPSADFQQDAIALLSGSTYLQSADPVVGMTVSMPPPPASPQTDCDWYLPPPEVGTSLLTEFLNDFNTALPLYRPHVIADHLRTCYAGKSDGTAVAWTSTYVVFGLAHMLRAMSTTGTAQDNEMAKYYLARVYSALSKLLVAPPSLGLVQCLMGVAWLISTTPCSYSLSEGRFVSTALHIIQGLTYQEDATDELTSTRDVEQERRVFWLAFLADTNGSILTNSPTTHRQEDVVKCYPGLVDSSDTIGALIAVEGNWRVGIFELRVQLALLQAEAIDQVLSLSTRNTTPMDLVAATTIVLAKLETFHQHEIFQVSASQLFQMLYQSDVSHTVSLEASYFATVYRVHAFLAFDMKSRLNPFSIDGLKRMAEVKKHQSFATAKRLLSLLPVAPRGDVGLYWMLYCMMVAALVTVFAHHINNPSEAAPAPNEMRGYLQVLADLGEMAQNSANPDLVHMRDLCASLFSKLEGNMRIRWIQDIAERNDTITTSTLASVRAAHGISSL